MKKVILALLLSGAAFASSAADIEWSVTATSRGYPQPAPVIVVPPPPVVYPAYPQYVVPQPPPPYVREEIIIRERYGHRHCHERHWECHHHHHHHYH